ncbi:ATP-binding protein [Nonomuraea ferruginea]|uniref:ATP-binding protein n=1 Tax=Nonomuraea ferruginea TaxID=46174 RepID=A0ABT4SQI6_9ACTN|nr:ATP-binding protein [Nonomuraea ferruginea]MDA0639531.1 ATP-binding protein [Nonomuraea ferruginea]
MSVASPATWRNYTELPVHPLSVSLARKHVARVLTDWGRETLIDDAQLAISELVTNGIKASDPSEDEVAIYGTLAGSYRRVRVGLHQADAGVVLEVWDCSRRPPKLRCPEAEALGGRGLYVVDAVASSWGYRWPRTGGKVVWVLLGESS